MIKVLLFSVIILSLQSLYASEASNKLKNRLGNKAFSQKLKENERQSAVQGSSVQTTEVVIDSTDVAPQSCTRKEQTSIPKWAFESLLEYNPPKVRVQSATANSAGAIQIDGGRMIGNCNSMLRFNWSVGEGGADHALQVEVRTPNQGCREVQDENNLVQKCKYKVQTADNGVTNDKWTEFEFEPNYYGFVDCLEKTGALSDDSGKIAYSKFKLTKSGVNSSGQIKYYCRGPECSVNEEGKEVRNGLSNGDKTCQHTQDIIPGGLRILSKDDYKSKKMKERFKAVCETGDYKTISSRLPEFSEFQNLQNILAQIRDNLLLQKVRLLTKEIRNSDNLSSFNANEYLTTFKDFYTDIIVKRRKDIDKLKSQMSSMKTEEKKMAQAALDNMIKELTVFMKDPYPATDVYNKMKSFAKKAPLHKEAWRNAALYAYKTQNTGFHYIRYHSKWGPKFRGQQDKKGEVYALGLSPNEVHSLMKNDIAKEETKLNRLGSLASDETGSLSYANQYLEKAEDVQLDYQYKMQDLQSELMEARQDVAECYNSAAGMWGFLRQDCVEKNNNLQREIFSDIQYYGSEDYQQNVLNLAIQEQMNQANYWAGIERDRNSAYGITPAPRRSRTTQDMLTQKTPDFSNRLQENWLMQQEMQRQALQKQWSDNYTNMGWGNNNNRWPASGQPWVLNSGLAANNNWPTTGNQWGTNTGVQWNPAWSSTGQWRL